MEDEKEPPKKYIKYLTEKEKPCYVESDKYIMHFSQKLTNGDSTYRCKFYKDKLIKCKAYVKFDSNGNLKSFSDNHTCSIDTLQIQKLKIMNSAKDSLKNMEDIYTIKARDIFNNSIKKAIKRKYDYDEEEANIEKHNLNLDYKPIKSPTFDNVKHNIYRYINKQIPQDIDNLKDMPEESDFYKTIKGGNFLAYKTDKMLIFMSKIQAQLFYEYNDHVFIDGTFYSAPKSAYQIITIRVHNIVEDRFHTVAYGVLVNKNLDSYIEFFESIKSYTFENRENKHSNVERLPKTIHCDFELALIGAIKQSFPNTEIKLCLWHFFRNIEIHRKKIFGSLDNQSEESLNILKRIKTLCYIDPNYLAEVFDIISEDAINSDENDNKFVNIYFKKTYIDKFNIKDWNYYKTYDHKTNNSCESFHHVLNGKFNNKPTIWKFISVIKTEENNLELEIENIKNGEILLKRKKRGIKSFKLTMMKYYDAIDEKIKKINDSMSLNKHTDIVNIWYESLLVLPLYDYNV